MSYPPRYCVPNATYHCYSRCIELRNLLSPDYVKKIAVESIEMAQEKYDFQLIQNEFVENHFHFIIRTTSCGESISRIMQYIKARIAEKYNRMAGRTGPFWNERFKCKIVEMMPEPEKYFFRLMWYIAYNPVRKGVVDDPRDSCYGTIGVYLGLGCRSGVKITLHEYYLSLGNCEDERIRRFLQYEEQYKLSLDLGLRAHGGEP